MHNGFCFVCIHDETKQILQGMINHNAGKIVEQLWQVLKLTTASFKNRCGVIYFKEATGAGSGAD